MKKIIVMSDSHLYNSRIDYVLEKEKDADMFLHCGDICVSPDEYPQIITVSGNNEYFEFPMEIVLEIEGHRLIMFHSHQFSYLKREQKMIQAAKENNCDIICYGHTHISEVSIIDGIQVINPGSLQMSRDGKDISYAVMHISVDSIEVELKFIESNKKSCLPWR